MTSAHVFYIPIIFMLGFLAGMLANSKNKVEQDNKPTPQLVSGRVLVGSLLVFVFTFAGTHFFTIPRSAHAVHHALNGAEIFDKHPSYTASEVYERIFAFTPAGLELYKQFTYTTDLLFPLTLFVFLLLLSLHTSQRIEMPKKYRLLLTVAPMVWLGLDVLENGIVFNLLDNFPARNDFLAGILGYVTITKFSLLFVSIAIPAIVRSSGKKLSLYFLRQTEIQ